MMKMLVEVKQKHIDEGILYLCGGCPIALAVKEATGSKVVMVGYGRISVNGEPVYRWYGDNDTVAQFIKAFDCNHKVSPFSFEIDYEPPN